MTLVLFATLTHLPSLVFGKFGDGERHCDDSLYFFRDVKFN